ncbi:hypothetical protein CONPUDRAFT_63444, partial [Coniophora puteana RWD-64-598 SS2]
HEVAVTLGYTVDPSTMLAYMSALNLYLNFCCLHHLPFQSTTDTFAKYIVFMQTYIHPKSITSYLSGICNQLEHLYPEVCVIQMHPFIVRPLSQEHLQLAADLLYPQDSYDDSLFLAQLLIGFYALMCTSKLMVPDQHSLLNHCKLSMRNTITVSASIITFNLPQHKANKTFEGNKIIMLASTLQPTPHDAFLAYLKKHDTQWPFKPHLWVRENSSLPTRTWFMHRLHDLFPLSIASHPLRSGGATAMAEDGIPAERIQAVG